MTTPSEQWVVNALRQATDRLPVPPESRWIPEPRSTSRASTIAVVGAAAILIIAVIGGLSALRAAPRVVPGANTDVFAVREDAEWRLAQSMLPTGLALLRPTWIPAEFRGSAECPSPWATLDSLGPGYTVRYQSDRLPNGRCAWLVFTGVSKIVSHAGISDGLEDTGTVNARGTTVHVRSGTPQVGIGSPVPVYQIRLWWNESGATYEVMSNDLEIADLVRVLRSLEPMR
jgi:hypothetical protein